MIRYPVSCSHSMKQLMCNQLVEFRIVGVQVYLHRPLVISGVIRRMASRTASKSSSLSESQPAKIASQNISSRLGRCVLLLRREHDGVKAITDHRPPSYLDLMSTSNPLMSSDTAVGLIVCILFLFVCLFVCLVVR